MSLLDYPVNDPHSGIPAHWISPFDDDEFKQRQKDRKRRAAHPHHHVILWDQAETSRLKNNGDRP